ncbi:hypothetical protein C2Q23_01365 [Campylobacter coli]|nr:hypothetical protein [Campylobacter coli]
MRLKGEFQQCLKQFVEKVEELKKQGITVGSEPGKWKKQIDGLIQDFDYVCSVNFGSGNLSDYPAINFLEKIYFIKATRMEKHLRNNMVCIFGFPMPIKKKLYIWHLPRPINIRKLNLIARLCEI